MRRKIALTISMAVALSMAAPCGYANAAVIDDVVVAKEQTMEEVSEETSEQGEIVEEVTTQEVTLEEAGSEEENVEALVEDSTEDKKFFDDEEERAIKDANDEYSGTYSCEEHEIEIHWEYDANSKKITLTSDDWIGESSCIGEYPWEKFKDEVKELEVKGDAKSVTAFKGYTKLEKVILPDSVSNIDFSGCTSLVDINIPSNLTGMYNAFENCVSLKKIDLSNAKEVNYIVNAFMGCTALEEVVGLENVKANSFDHTFYGCSSLKTVKLPETTEYITFAFYGCSSLEEIVIPEKVSYMPRAFVDCSSLEEIVIPSNVEMAYDSFTGCSKLRKVTFEENKTYLVNLKRAFIDCTSLEEINLPDNVFALEAAFQNCTSLKEVRIPESTNLAGAAEAFYGCTGLKVLHLPNNVWYYSFDYNKSLFKDCNLDKIYLYDYFNSIMKDSFQECPAKELVYVGTLDKFESIVNETITFSEQEIIYGRTWFGGTLITSKTIPALKSAENKDGKVAVQWDALDNELVDGYNVYRKTDSSDWELIGNASGTSFTDTKAEGGTKYYYSVSGTGVLKRVPFETGYDEDGIVVETPKSDNKNDDKKDEGNKKEDNKTTEDKTTENKKEDNKTTESKNDKTTEDKTTEDKKEETKPEKVADVTVSYHTHIQSIGDGQGNKKNGQMAGTVGQSKRLESINIAVSGNDNLGIAYTTHVQSIGWLPWSANNELSGTTGESKRLEAIKIILTGKDADKYDIYYRVHAQSYGWLDWAKNGEIAGTAGLSKRLEAIQIVVVEKNKAIDKNMGGIKSTNAVSYVIGTSNTSEPAKYEAAAPNVLYRTHVQTIGWQNWKANGTMAGTSGMSKRLEGINIKLTNCDYTGGIQYKTHVQTYGWEKEWKSNGAMSGTSGESKRLEAIMIELTGEMAKHYDVYYRVHSQTYGWLAWAKNGEPAGTEGMSKRLEGIQIVVVKKGDKAPANNYGGVESANSKSFLK